MATKTLKFSAFNLKKETTLMLMFDPPNPERLYKDQFPVAWKVITLQPGGHVAATVTYAPRFAFGHDQNNAGNLVSAATWIEVKSGDSTSFIGSSQNGRFTPVANVGTTKLFTAQNGTKEIIDLSMGFAKGDGADQSYEPALVWRDIGAGSNITVEFTPNCTAYLTSDYKESQMLHGEVQSPKVWAKNLNQLRENTEWKINELDDGSFSIEPVHP